MGRTLGIMPNEVRWGGKVLPNEGNQNALAQKAVGKGGAPRRLDRQPNTASSCECPSLACAGPTRRGRFAAPRGRKTTRSRSPALCALRPSRPYLCPFLGGGPGHNQLPHLQALFLWRPAPSHARPYRAGRRDTSGASRTPANKSLMDRP